MRGLRLVDGNAEWTVAGFNRHHGVCRGGSVMPPLALRTHCALVGRLASAVRPAYVLLSIKPGTSGDHVKRIRHVGAANNDLIVGAQNAVLPG